MTFLRMIVIASAVLALGGCADATRSCFVGFSLFPPSPVVLCGLDVEPQEVKGE